MSSGKSLAEIFQGLAGSQKLERDRGLYDLQRSFVDISEEAFNEIQAFVEGKLGADFSRWEEHHGVLTAARVLACHVHCSDDFGLKLKDESARMLEHEEYRVRIAAGDALAQLCCRMGPGVYIDLKATIFKGIKDNISRLIPVHRSCSEKLNPSKEEAILLKKFMASQEQGEDSADSVTGVTDVATATASSNSPKGTLDTSPRPVSPAPGHSPSFPPPSCAPGRPGSSLVPPDLLSWGGAPAAVGLGGRSLAFSGGTSPRTVELLEQERKVQIFHDTAGWKKLETWMKCLQCMIDGCEEEFGPHVDQELVDLLFQSLSHTNRFVRETGYEVLGSLISAVSLDGNGDRSSCGKRDRGAAVGEAGESPIKTFGEQFTKHLSTGLSDNWSQVRLASSQATRKFLLAASDEDRRPYYPILLPKMCLNRYYVADGVRIYSQETWRLVTKNSGIALVEEFIEPMVAFYVSQTEADNHAVREAACSCIAELVAKLNPDAVRLHVSSLLDALLVCFHDESWPVRDSACVACGKFVQAFPGEASQSMSQLYPLFFENLRDGISSVRQGAATALACVAKAYEEDSMDIIISRVKEGLEGVATQPSDGAPAIAPATLPLRSQSVDITPDRFTDQTMYSCGSLAPKMKGGKSHVGCFSGVFKRAPEPWFLADGALMLLGELAAIPSFQSVVSDHLQYVAEASKHRHYAQHVSFLETLCHQIPNLASRLGKRIFKQHLESFLDAVFHALSCDNALTSSAASQCLNRLGQILGLGILRGRVENYNPRYVSQLDANGMIAPM